MKKKKNNEVVVGKAYTEDWLPLKQIVNGMIQLDTGEFVTGIKVAPKNIFILDQGTQDNIIYQLQSFYNMIDYEFWLIIADRPVDINMYISQLQVLYRKTADPVARKIISQDINKANLFMTASYNVVDTEYFILFKEKRMELIQKNLHNMISSLANCGLNSSQVSNDDLRMLLDNFFNDRESTTFGTVMA